MQYGKPFENERNCFEIRTQIAVGKMTKEKALNLWTTDDVEDASTVCPREDCVVDHLT